MTKEEAQAKIRQLNNEITQTMKDEMAREYGIIKRYQDHEENISKIEMLVALYDIANLALIDAVQILTGILTTQENLKEIIDSLGIPTKDDYVDSGLRVIGKLIEHITDVLKNTLAPDTKTIYIMCNETWGNEKDLNSQGNPQSATSFYHICHDKMKEMERIEKEVTQ